MCNETDYVESESKKSQVSSQADLENKNKTVKNIEKTENENERIPKGLPEPGKPIPIPEDSMVPPQNPTNMEHKSPTIANQEIFEDQDLSSMSA